jgi:hypothetical protein
MQRKEYDIFISYRSESGEVAQESVEDMLMRFPSEMVSRAELQK